MPHGKLKISFILAAFVHLSCSSPALKNQSVENKPGASPSVQISRTDIQTPGEIDFKGISFKYDPQIFTEIKPEEIAETPLQSESDKPGGEYPNHVSFNFKIANQKREGSLKILPIEDYKRMYAVWKNYEKILGEQFDDLKKVIKDTNFRRDGEIPFIPYYDAHQTFQAKVQRFSFQNGQGIFFLTQINQESLLINNEMTEYYFQGITSDGKYYILAEFPVNVSFLPDSSEADEFEDYKLSIKNQADVKRFDEYVAKLTKRLAKLPPAEFQPNLKYYEEIISSLKIEN